MMNAPDERAAAGLFQAALEAAGVTMNQADRDRLGRSFRDYLMDGRRLTEAVEAKAEPLPVVRVEE